MKGTIYMRKIITVLLSLFLFLGIASLYGCDEENESSGAVVNGTNASETDEFGKTEVKVPLEGGKYKIEVYYKPSELKEEEYYYDANDNEEYYVDYEYNDKGQLVRLHWSDGELGISHAEFYEYDYDESGRLIQKRVLNGIQMPEKTYDYNADGTVDLLFYPRENFPVYTNLYAKNATEIIVRLNSENKKDYADGYSQQYGHLFHIDFDDDGKGTMETYDMWSEAETRPITYVTTFDKDLQLLKETFYSGAQIISVTTGTFDNSGKLTGKHEKAYNKDKTLQSESEYNLSSELVWYKNYDHGVLCYTEVNEFDATTGKVVKTEKTDPDGNLIVRSTYEYYDNGDIRTIRYYDENGNFSYRTEYDEEGFEQSFYTE